MEGCFPETAPCENQSLPAAHGQQVADIDAEQPGLHLGQRAQYLPDHRIKVYRLPVEQLRFGKK